MRSSSPTLRIFQSPFTKLVGWSTAKLPALRAILKWEIMHGLLNDTGRINTRTGFSKEKRSALRFLQQAPKRWATFFRCTRKEVTLFCREFHYWRIYAFFVLILGVQKCACAIFYAFCMSGGTPATPPVTTFNFYSFCMSAVLLCKTNLTYSKICCDYFEY